MYHTAGIVLGGHCLILIIIWIPRAFRNVLRFFLYALLKETKTMPLTFYKLLCETLGSCIAMLLQMQMMLCHWCHKQWWIHQPSGAHLWGKASPAVGERSSNSHAKISLLLSLLSIFFVFVNARILYLSLQKIWIDDMDACIEFRWVLLQKPINNHHYRLHFGALKNSLWNTFALFKQWNCIICTDCISSRHMLNILKLQEN